MWFYFLTVKTHGYLCIYYKGAAQGRSVAQDIEEAIAILECEANKSQILAAVEEGSMEIMDAVQGVDCKLEEKTKEIVDAVQNVGDRLSGMNFES